MNLKDLIFGGGVKSGGDGGTYRDSIQAWLPIKNIIGGVVITKDGRFVKILELLPVNIYLKSPNDRQNIISSFAAYLKIAPNDLQMVARTLPADTQAYVEQMQRYAEKEDNEACREMIEDNIQEIGNGIASDAMRHRFFLVFQYEASMRAKRNTVDSITLAVALLSTECFEHECCHITLLPLEDAHDFFAAHSSDYASQDFYSGQWC